MLDKLSYLTQYYTIFNKTRIISRTNLRGVITSVNQNFCDISGYSKEELVGSSHSKIRHPEMKDAVFKKMWKTITAGKIWQGEVKNSTKDNGFYWTKSVIFPIFDESKNIIEYASFREDITKRKLLELKIEKEDNLRREILHSQASMVILLHKVKGVVFMNHQCFLDLPFDSRAEFMKEHKCICELFIEKEKFLKKSTDDRHWLEDFDESPNIEHKAIMLNKQNEEEIYRVDVNELHDNKNLIVINFTNITKLEKYTKHLKVEKSKNKNLELKIENALEKIKENLSLEGENKILLEELQTVLNSEHL
ncbi:MAG: PAS domain-containing protein [Campylobacterota bacterium]|nr:PAS domain-containing protein [Campylobacterota bacterium]